MTSHRILNPVEHGALRVRADAAPELGDGVMSCLVVPAEFRRLAPEYPILFRFDPASQGFSALALFGFEAGGFFLHGVMEVDKDCGDDDGGDEDEVV